MTTKPSRLTMQYVNSFATLLDSLKVAPGYEVNYSHVVHGNDNHSLTVVATRDSVVFKTINSAESWFEEHLMSLMRTVSAGYTSQPLEVMTNDIIRFRHLVASTNLETAVKIIFVPLCAKSGSSVYTAKLLHGNETLARIESTNPDFTRMVYSWLNSWAVGFLPEQAEEYPAERNNMTDNYLDETYESVMVGGMEFHASDIMFNCDPVAYRCLTADLQSSYGEDDDTDFSDE